MRTPRDYKAEHARRSAVQIAKSVGPDVSFWRQTTSVALLKLFGNELSDLVMAGKIPDAQLYQLLQLARWKPEGARQLLKRPQDIEIIYRKNKAQMAAARPKRVSAKARVERAWPGYWDACACAC